MTNEEKAIVSSEYKKVWSDQHMIDYCTRKTDIAIILSDKSLFTIDKESIETRFCFGYHDSPVDTESYDSANESAEYARKSESYFREENIENLKRQIKLFQDNSYKHIVIKNYDMHSDCKIVVVKHIRGWEMEDNDIELSEVDRQAIIKGYEKALENKNKRIDTYLKKYGLSKVQSWSYWMDE